MTLLDGRLALTTPEGVRLPLTPAGPAVRGYAWAIDTIVWGLSVAGLAAILGPGRLAGGLFLLALFLLFWAYPVVCEVYLGGATLGKRIAGLEVVRDDGLPVGWRESALRNLLLTADFLPAAYATGLVCMLFDTRFRRLGDLAAGTLVVYRERDVERRATVVMAAPEPAPWPLTVAQQRALIDLFAREDSLPAERMEELATLAEPLTGRTGAASLARLRGIAAGLVR